LKLRYGAMIQFDHAIGIHPEAPVCTVCIANFNGVGILSACIDSVLAQVGGMSVEIIIHDDCSSDGSVEWIRKHYPHVDVLASRENVGFCVANNRMAAIARGKFVLLLNNDAELYPDAIATLVSESELFLRPAILSLPQFDWSTGNVVDRGRRLDPFYNSVPNFDSLHREVAMVIGACMFMPRSLWVELGGFPDWFGSMAEDMYLCCLARLRGYPVAVSHKSGYRHRQGVSFGGSRTQEGRLVSTYRRRALSERNKTFALVICTPTPLLWPLLALHCLLLAFEGLALSLINRDSKLWRDVYWGTLGEVVRKARTLKRTRDAVQGRRVAGTISFMRQFVVVPRKLVMLFRFGLPRIA